MIPNMIDLNLNLNDISLCIKPDKYCDDLEQRKVKIYLNNELKLEKNPKISKNKRYLHVSFDFSNLDLSDDSSILVSLE